MAPRKVNSKNIIIQNTGYELQWRVTCKIFEKYIIVTSIHLTSNQQKLCKIFLLVAWQGHSGDQKVKRN